MLKNHILPLLLAFLMVSACKKEAEELNLDPETEALVSILQDELFPLHKDPLTWEDADLQWLDPLANKAVVGLGEATHGSAEFFDAKHRIFRYMVENHGYKVFAFEADFGESLFIEEAVQEGNTAAIESLMKNKMHFWTWKTEEVKELLEWMCTYNQDKADEDKVHYMGVDCQFNTYHPALAREYLELTAPPFLAFADSIFQVVERVSGNNFAGYNAQTFENYLGKLEAVLDSMILYKNELVLASSEKEYLLNERIIRVIIQVSEVRYYYTRDMSSAMDSRDRYMADNTIWLQDYYENMKTVVWAHNYHISDHEGGNISTMGAYLRYALGDQYAIVGFLFSQGTFTAVTMDAEEYVVESQTLDSIPKAGSLNALMSHTGEAAFSIEVGVLANYLAWYNAFENYMQYFSMGAGYNNSPGDYYVDYDPDLFHYLIYFDQSTASVLLQ